jgi:hypothetical protein
MAQTTVSAVPTKAYDGQLADEAPNDIISTRVDESAGIDPGLVVMRTANGDDTAGLVPAVALDVDSIKTNIGSTAGTQNFTTADFNGVIGAGRISPPALLELVFSSHADWDATTATITGLDENGVPITDTIAIPNGGNATVLTTKYFSRVLTLSIPAQTSTGGTATFGTAASVSMDGGDVLGISVRTQKTLITPSSSNNEHYEDEDLMPVLRHGRIFVKVENAFRAGDVPMVRAIAAGAEKLGAIRAHDTDSGDCFPLRRARLLSSGSAGEYGLLEVNL